MTYQEARRQAHRKALKITSGLIRENPISEIDVKQAVDLIIEAAVAKVQEVGMEIEMPVEGQPENIKRIVRVRSIAEIRDIGMQDGCKQAVSDTVSLIDEFLSDDEPRIPVMR